jgi:hypothetical protein
LTGTAGNSPVIHRCGPDILHYADNTAVCVNEDFDMTWTVPQSFVTSTFAERTQRDKLPLKVEATVFIWVLKYLPNREFRFWLNEEREKPQKGQKTKEDIWRRRITMQLPD